MIEIIGQIGRPATQDEIEAFKAGEEETEELPCQMEIGDFPEVLTK